MFIKNGPKVKRIDMALHIQELCAKHDISVKYQSLEDKVPNYWARPKSRTICIRPTKNTGHYVSALHEIGHIVGDYQDDAKRIYRELYAWVYAVKVAKVWTDTADRVAWNALESYGWDELEKRMWTELKNRALGRN